MKQLKRWTAWICALTLILTLSPAVFAATPVSSDNINDQDYRHISCRGEFSFLYANEQGGVTRVEYLHGKTVVKQDSAGNSYMEEDGGKILVEDYDASFNCLSSRTLPMELPVWGGFLAGEDYNFIITGKDNTRESDDVEVYRVTKYSKDWQRLGAASIRAVDTAVPFSGQAARMAEGNGYLYVHTAQTMYTDGAGDRHNGCMTLQIQESDMTLAGVQHFSDNESYFAGGVVSHSFNEFILVDQDDNIVSLDHGDGYPRGVALYRYATKAGPEPFAQGKTESAIIQKFGGRDTVTGAAVSGFAETSSGYVAAYNYDGVGDIGDRSVYLGYVSKNGLTPSATKLSGPGTAAPQLAPTGLDGGYILWNGQTTQPAQGGGVEHVMDNVLHYARYSADGTVGSVQTAAAALSDCRPIYFNGKAVWYVTNNSAPTFYTLDSSGVQSYGGGASVPSEPSEPSKPSKPSGAGNLNLTLDVMLAPPTFSATSIVTNDGVRYVYNGSGYTQRSDSDCIATGDGWAIRSDNSLWVWTNGVEDLSAPKKVLDGVRTASIGGEAGCLALKTDGTLWGFRNQNLDQPEMLSKDIVQIYTSHYDNACQYAVTKIGGLLRRYLGDHETQFTGIMFNVSAFDNNGTGDSFFIVRNFDGALYYWGNIRGEDDIIAQASPQKIMEKVVSFDTYNRLAITSDGCLYGIGNAKADPEYLTDHAVVVRDGLVLKQDGTLWRISYDYSGNSYSGLTKVAENVKLPNTGSSSGQSGSTSTGTTNPGTTNPGTTNPGTTTPGTTNPGTTTPGTTASGTANPFVDVSDSAYYKDAVLWALENGVTTGVDATHFQPNSTCTRGQVVTFLWRAKGSPEPKTQVNPFTDVKSSSAFYKAILWAYENNITTGTTSTTFNPGGTCTNGHVLTFLWRSNGQPAASGSSSLANQYPNQYFTNAVAWAQSKGLLNNGGSGLTPGAQCPRADIVAYLYRNAANS